MKFCTHCSNCSSFVSSAFPSFWRTCRREEKGDFKHRSSKAEIKKKTNLCKLLLTRLEEVKKYPLFHTQNFWNISPHSHSWEKDLQANQDELRPLLLCCTKQHDWLFSFTGLMLFADKAIATQLFISWTSKKQTTSLRLLLCGYAYPDLTLVSGPDRVGFFAPRTAGLSSKPESQAETSLDKEGCWSTASPTFFSPFLTMHMLGKSWLLRTTKDLTPWIYLTESKCHVWECQQPVLFLSPPPCTAQLPTDCKKVLIRLLPLSTSSLNDLFM